MSCAPFSTNLQRQIARIDALISITEKLLGVTQMSEEEMRFRLECLRLATGIATSIIEAEAGNAGDTVARAQRYYDFITGASAASPRDAINAALDAANVK